VLTGDRVELADHGESGVVEVIGDHRGPRDIVGVAA
jgi:hypothetical protein